MPDSALTAASGPVGTADPCGAAAIVAGSLAAALILSACGGDDGKVDAGTSGDKGTVTLYNAQHEDLMKLLADGFTAKTGITVEMRNGDDFEPANHIVQEGDKSPADVFATENSPAMTLVAGKDGFAPVDKATLANIPAQYSPKDGSWVGFAARSTVRAYNTDKLTDADLPAGILDLAEPTWRGKIGMSPSGANSDKVKLDYFGYQDPGAFVSVSGAGHLGRSQVGPSMG